MIGLNEILYVLFNGYFINPYQFLENINNYIFNVVDFQIGYILTRKLFLLNHAYICLEDMIIY